MRILRWEKLGVFPRVPQLVHNWSEIQAHLKRGVPFVDSRVLLDHILNVMFLEDAQMSACGTPGYPWAKSATTCLVNKILLEQSLTHLFTYHLWLLSSCNSRAKYLHWRQEGPQSLKHDFWCFIKVSWPWSTLSCKFNLSFPWLLSLARVRGQSETRIQSGTTEDYSFTNSFIGLFSCLTSDISMCLLHLCW